MSIVTKSFALLSRFVKPTIPNRVTNPRTIARWVAPTMREIKKRRDKIGPDPEEPRSSYLEWNYEAEIFAFGKRLGEEFDRDLLKQALIQREYANLQEFKSKEQGQNLPQLSNNHELIQEGEALISNYVRKEYSQSYPEDVVNSVHDYLTSKTMLAHVGTHIGLKDLILTNEYPVAEETLSNTFKAVVAALKHSKNQTTAETFVKDFVVSNMHEKEISDIFEPKDPYDYLMTILNDKGIKDVEPRICNEAASNTILACFQVGIYSNKKLLGIGWGESIPIAQDTAALDAIHRLYKDYVPN